MYTYNCRECPIQKRCINQSDTAAHIKEMIRNAFAARTDTVSTWAVLQNNCLLVKEDEERERRAREGTELGRRLREVREAKEQSDETPPEDASQPADQAEPSPSITITSYSSHTPPVVPSTPFQIETPTSQASSAGPEETLRARSREPAQLHPQVTPKRSALCWLIINDGQRHISLPVTGKLVLGRFDPGATSPLDVDLTYEDRDMLTVSRRHARIVGVDGYHTVEDLGSSNGVLVNGKQITLARAHPLRPGDEIALGGLQMRYEKVPTKSLSTFSIEATQVRRFLFLAHTGRKVAIAPPNNIIIGRSDPAADFVPGIDLSQDGEVASRVSRRHARITWTKHGPCLKDLNSTFGTRFNGATLHPDQAVLLKPGDHISLGGCVLAYDIEE